MIKKLVIVLIFIKLLSIAFLGSAFAGTDIIVTINNAPLRLDTPPVLVSNRVLVPLRAISEAIGAEVVWKNDGTVRLSKAERVVSLSINDRVALIDASRTQLDVPPMIIGGRTMVPLRFIGEAFDIRVNWNRANRSVEIFYTGLNLTEPNRTEVPIPADRLSIVSSDGHTIFIGMDQTSLTAALGVPVRREPTFYGFEWWVYNSISGSVTMAGVAQNALAVFYTNSTDWTVAGIRPGDDLRTLTSKHMLKDRIQLTAGNARITKILDREALSERPLVISGDQAVTFYLDTALDREVSGIRIMDIRRLLAFGGYSMQWFGNLPDSGIPALTSEQRQSVFEAQERILLELVNSFRIKNGLNALLLHEELTNVARSHSLDMFNNNFFAHFSPTAGSLTDRVNRANITFRNVGENLAFNQPDAIGAHQGLINSPGHRENLLVRSYTHAGIGVIERYYTQKFLNR